MMDQRPRATTRDEEHLARLVLLVDLPSTTNEGDIRQPQAESASDLQRALEHNDCTLLCLVGRLIVSYTSYEQALSESATDVASRRDAKHALLRLAVRVAFLRYAPLATMHHAAAQLSDHRNLIAEFSADRIFEWEKCLLKSLHAAFAIITKRQPRPIQDVEAEMAWSIVGLLNRLNEKASPNNSRNEVNQVVRNLWIESINILMARRQGARNLPTAEATHRDDCIATCNSDETLMARTINSILDGSHESSMDKNKDWAGEFDTAIASCFRNFLETPCNPIVTSKILLGMIQLSQQNDTISLDLYWIILHYLDLCIHRALGDAKTQTNGVLSVTYQQNVDKLQPYFFTDTYPVSKNSPPNEPFLAIKSFLFYGLVSVCNDLNVSSCAISSPSENSSVGDRLQLSPGKDHVSLRRVNIYSVFLGLWQLLGPEWLYQPSTLSSDVNHCTLDTSDWWQKSDFTANKGGSSGCLGQTWQLCTLVRLAAGEFRLSMGLWMTSIEDNASSTGTQKLGPYNSVVSGIGLCARIVVQAVDLMTNLAGFQDEDIINQINSSDGQGTIWKPDAILHIRESLEDALNTSVQYFNDNDFTAKRTMTSSDSTTQREWEEIGRACCVVIGAIAPELELDHLLASHENEQSDPSSFVSALCAAILFSDYVSKNNQPNSKDEMPFEYNEPLSCFLPCIMSIVSSAISDFDQVNIYSRDSAQRVLVTVSQDANFVNIISDFLCICIRHESHYDKVRHQSSTRSLARLAYFIMTGLLDLSLIENSSSRLQLTTTETNKLTTSLMHWERHFIDSDADKQE
ncbi:hypothetical protein HJC23_005927 [Cyclotella cryptica]|uniref:Uncharacterized protein n=1 Tax=Cyclotella cryptica TaxID=29204 RepID=A0ABD3QZ29_9STRA